MRRATAREIADRVIKSVKVLLASRIQVRCAPIIIIIHRLLNVLKRVEERRERRMVGKRMILELL